MINVQVFLEEGASLPSYETENSAGMDVKAHLTENVTVNPGERKLVSTGIRMAIPAGYEAQVRPRSGLSFKNGITVLNTPGTIDADYRGIVGVIVQNHSAEPFVVENGMRIAQIVFNEVKRGNLSMVSSIDDLGKTDRGEGGFGHTGV